MSGSHGAIYFFSLGLLVAVMAALGVFLGFKLVGGGDESKVRESRPSVNRVQTGSEVSNAENAGSVVYWPQFETPSGNIACNGAGDGLMCAIEEYQYAWPLSPDPPDCQLDYEGMVAIDSSGVTGVCKGDIVSICQVDPQYGGAQCPVLQYGDRWSVNGVSCESAETGLRCSNESGEGFVLSRYSFKFLN